MTTPYRYPKKQKDEIEKAIKELLDMGYIRPRKSPFALTVVLVKKKDGTMRMGVDYRALNQKTIKNQYPIPRIDELIDEIHGVVKSWTEHLQHLDEVLSILESELLFAKELKCEFGMRELLYLGHIISAEGVKVDLEKIKAIIDRPPLENITHLKGFLGLCGFYRRFVKGYSQLAAPLTDLTKKGAFEWSEKAQAVFDQFKEIMSSCIVLV
ncbi:uncharacterized mitochondrial protein AtMg00860-like [Cryptomeria japonica]|uniref:uncharacterized mitochondrial protein AtMg00860-like n=1 Tax=Cryptomeria japonica TaxID=3369 RepID=UPI0025AB627C|nr:uncharacterized mitochondrial protein AtMg00860-like [Cryptomeria japonica]